MTTAESITFVDVERGLGEVAEAIRGQDETAEPIRMVADGAGRIADAGFRIAAAIADLAEAVRETKGAAR